MKKEITDLLDKAVCIDGTFNLSDNNDLEYISSLNEEALLIGGAVINVFKLLGIHEQGRLVDLTGNGRAISSSSQNNFPAENAFKNDNTIWKSNEKGADVTLKSFLGYDFGPIKLSTTGREKYGIDTKQAYHITTIKIQQDCEGKNRITSARVEYSLNGSKWHGVSIISLPDDHELNTIHIKTSAPARYWRIRPLKFNGGENDAWKVNRVQLIDYRSTDLKNIQDEYGFLESRDRDYSQESVQIKGSYDLIDHVTDLTRFGIQLSSQMIFSINFLACVRALGRPVIIGDIFELPSETQYGPDLKAVLKYVEVTDVTWANEGYTPGWQPTLLRVMAQPLIASQETLDIIGNFVPDVDDMGLFDPEDDNLTLLTDDDNTIQSVSSTLVPESGEDSNSVRVFTEEELQKAKEQGINLQKLNYNQRGLYVEDGLPPNGLPYTEANDFPENPSDGDYHRLTYTQLKDPVPPRLYKYSELKQRWIYCETDRRFEYNGIKPKKKEILNKSTSKPLDKI